MTTLLATVHPAFALRMRRWQDVLCGTRDDKGAPDGMYVGDIAKAVRAAKGILRWTDPAMLLDPTAEQLSAALASMAGLAVAVDTETDGLDPEHCNLRCVGFAVADGPYGGGHGVCATFRSIDGTPGRYIRADSTKYQARCRVADARAIIQAFFARLRQPDGPKAILMHNQVYDQPVLQRHGLHPPDVARVVDTVLLHRLADSEMPHDLSFLASTMTDAPAWKQHDHDAWPSDEDLQIYNLRDVAITAACAPRLRDEVVRSGQLAVLHGDLESQRLAIGMRRAGVAVDFAEQRRHGDRLAVAMEEYRARADAATVGAPISVASADQVRHYLFRRLRVMPSGVETPLGDPSVDKEAMHLLLQRALPDRTRAFIAAVLDFRRVQKAKSSFVDNLEVDADGRVHAVWNAHSVKTGRAACSSPNLTTVPATKHDPDSLRSMFRAAPGNLMFGADYDQIHMRIIAVRANIADWLEVFDRAARGDTSRAADIHYVNAAKFYGKRIDAVQKFERSNLKTAVYAGVYAAGVDTWLAQYVQVRDPATGARPYAGMTRTECAAIRSKWLADTPEIPAWWEREVEAFRQGGELRSMLYGRLLRLKDVRYAGAESADAAVSDIVNAAVLCVPGYVRVLTGDGYIKIADLVGRSFVAWTGTRWASARAVFSSWDEVTEVWTDRGKRFACSADHKLLAVGKAGYEWREARALVANRRIAVDLARELDFGEDAPEEDAYHLGLWVADGSATVLPGGEKGSGGQVTVAWAIGTAEHHDGRSGPDAMARAVRWARSRGFVPQVHRSGSNCVQVNVSVGGDDWLRYWGADPAWKAHTKRVPDRIWRSCLRARKAFLRGVYAGDGTAHKGPNGSYVSIGLCQRALLDELWVLLRTVGVDSSVGRHPFRNGRGKNGRQLWIWRLRLSQSQAFSALGIGSGGSLFGAPSSYTPDWLCRRVRKGLVPTCAADRVIKSRIRKSRGRTNPYVLARMGALGVYDHVSVGTNGCKPRRVILPMYTLSVDDPEHSYVADGYISKNCTEADIAGGNGAAGRAMRRIGWPDSPAGRYAAGGDGYGDGRGMGGPGLTMHIHDAIYGECAAARAQEAKAALRESMETTLTWEGRSVRISAKPKAGVRWSELE